MCLNIFTVINIKILTNSNQQTRSYKFTSHIAFLFVVLITEMLEICIQTSYDQNVQLISKSYLPVVYGTPLSSLLGVRSMAWHCSFTRHSTVYHPKYVRMRCVNNSSHTTSGQPIWRGCTLRGEIGSYIYTSGFLRSLDELKNENYKNGMVE